MFCLIFTGGKSTDINRIKVNIFTSVPRRSNIGALKLKKSITGFTSTLNPTKCSLHAYHVEAMKPTQIGKNNVVRNFSDFVGNT